MSIDQKIISLEQVRRESVGPVASVDGTASAVPQSDTPPDFIKPRSIVDMTDMEQDAFLVGLRDRRLRAAQMIRQQKEAKAAVASAAARLKIEKKIAMVQRAEEKAGDALERLETQLFQLRALVLQNE